MTERILLVCTANVCRSPMAEALLRRELATKASDVEVVSAGFLAAGSPVDRKATWAMNRLGLDASSHVSAHVTSALQSHPDLILAMAREHLRTLSNMGTGVPDSAFTLKEFVSLARIEGRRKSGEPLDEYLRRVRAGRNPAAIISFVREADADVEDPIGRRKSAFMRCALDLQGLLLQVAELLYPSSE